MMRTRMLLSVVLLAVAMTLFAMPAAVAQEPHIEPYGQVIVERGDSAIFKFVIQNGDVSDYGSFSLVVEKPNGREIVVAGVTPIWDAGNQAYTFTWLATLHPGWYKWHLRVSGYGDTDEERLRITHPVHEK